MTTDDDLPPNSAGMLPVIISAARKFSVSRPVPAVPPKVSEKGTPSNTYCGCISEPRTCMRPFSSGTTPGTDSITADMTWFCGALGHFSNCSGSRFCRVVEERVSRAASLLMISLTVTRCSLLPTDSKWMSCTNGTGLFNSPVYWREVNPRTSTVSEKCPRGTFISLYCPFASVVAVALKSPTLRK